MIAVKTCSTWSALITPRPTKRLIRAAYAYGQRLHEGQMRHSGEPYFSHPVAVAAILTEQRLDDATIITALLHDTIEDTHASYADSPKSSAPRSPIWWTGSPS